MAERAVADEFEWSVATTPPTSRQRRLALAMAGVLFIVFVAVAPFANMQLARIDRALITVNRHWSREDPGAGLACANKETRNAVTGSTPRVPQPPYNTRLRDTCRRGADAVPWSSGCLKTGPH